MYVFLCVLRENSRHLLLGHIDDDDNDRKRTRVYFSKYIYISNLNNLFILLFYC